MNTFNNFRKTILCAISISGIVALLIYTDLYKKSVSDGISACLNVLVPSLFPFFFLSSFIVYTDCLSILTRKMNFFSKITGIMSEGLPAILLSVIGGFPVGGKTVATLYKEGKITERQARHLSFICVGAGPGFMVTFIGEGIFHNKSIGVLFLISNIISVITLSFLFRPFIKKEEKSSTSELKTKHYSLGECIVLSTESAVKSSLSMCGFVVIFVVINNLLSLVPIYSGYIASALEITSGMINFGNSFSIETTAFLIGFGGVCVHFQIFGIIKSIRINKILFVLARVLQGVVSAIYIHIMLYVFPVSKEVFSTINEEITPKLSTTMWGGFALILLSVIFLLSNNKQEVNLCAE